MKTSKVSGLATAVCVLSGCCKTQPPLPPLDAITEWSHPNGIGSGAACKRGVEREPNDSLVEANLPSDTKFGACESIGIDGSVGLDADAFFVWSDPCSSSVPVAALDPGPTDIRLCLFVACAVGKTGLDPSSPCGSGAEVYRLDEGLLGCCSTAGSVSVNMNCQSQYSPLGSLPEFDGFVLVDRPSATGTPSCEDYHVSFSL